MRNKINWEDVDWTLRNADISRSLGVSMQTVSTQRSARGKKLPPLARAKITEATWGMVDWTQRNATIAKSIGASMHAVSTQRIARNKKLPPLFRSHSKWSTVDWSLRTSVIAAQLKITPCMVNVARKLLIPNKNEVSTQ